MLGDYFAIASRECPRLDLIVPAGGSRFVLPEAHFRSNRPPTAVGTLRQVIAFSFSALDA